MAKSPLKVLFFTTALGNGGAEMHMVRVANHLDPSRVQAEIAVARAGGSYEPFVAPHVPLHRLARRDIGSSTLQVLRAIPVLARKMSRLQPDIVCSVMDLPNIAALSAVRLVPRPRRPKTALCVQIPPSIEYGQYSKRAGRFILPAIRATYPQADRVVALSKGVRDDLISLAPSLSPKISLAYNAGWDDTLPERAAEGLPRERPDEPLVVACGRLSAQKGFFDLIRAFAKVRQQMPARLWILGEGPLKSELTELALSLKVHSSIDFLGFQSNPFTYMRAADLFVLSSLYGVGNVVVEAMACGTPVVSTDCPHGPGEIIQNEGQGILTPVGEPVVLAEQMLRVLCDRDLQKTIGAGGLERSAAFHARKVAGDYAAVFEQLAGRSVERTAAAAGAPASA